MTLTRFLLAFIGSVIGTLLVIPIFILALPIWLVTLSRKIWNTLKPETSEWEDIIQFDPVLGWRAKPNMQAQMKTDSVYQLTTGNDGWRGDYSLKNCNTIVIGDSFVFGQGTNDNDHFALHTKISKVKPIGAPGYGTTHYLLLLKQLSTNLEGKLVIWFVFTGNDYREAIRPTSYGYHFPFVFYNKKTENYKIETSNITPKKTPFNFEKSYKTSMPELADLYHKNYFSDYAFGAFEYLVKEAKQHCESHGATFAVVTIPLWWVFDENAITKVKRHSSNVAKFSPHYPDERTAEICQYLKVPFKAGTDYFSREDYLPNDFHWSKAGNRKIAKVIDELYISLFKTNRS